MDENALDASETLAAPKKRVVVFTAGQLEPDVEIFLERLHASDRVELVAVVVDQWKRRWGRIRFLMKRWGLSVFLISLFYRVLQAITVKQVWRRWHDWFVPATSECSYARQIKKGVTVWSCEDINSAASAMRIKDFAPDLGVIVGGRILKNRITQIPHLGTLNIHKHDATKYRGSPQIGYPERVNGDDTLGVTIHFATSKVDQGDVIAMESIPIERYDDDRSLAIKAAYHGLDVYFHAIESVATGDFARISQDTTSGKTYITTPFVDRVRFWRKHRKMANASFVTRMSLGWHKAILQEAFRAFRFMSCIALLPWLARRRKQLEAAGNAPIVMLYYHGVGNGGENWMTLPMHRLHEDISYLRKHYKIFRLDEAVECLRSGQNHESGVVLTFDDAYESCYKNLVPYLNYYGIPATIFACTGAAVEGKLHAHDVTNGCEARSMTIPQLADVSSSHVEIGSHGNYHEDMGSLEGDELERAIVGSGDDLERLMARDVRYFSFPFGKKHHMSVDALARGRKRYDAMFSAYGGYNFPDTGTWFHFQRIANPTTLTSLVAIMNGLHRFRPFYVDRPARFCDIVRKKGPRLSPVRWLRRHRLKVSLSSG